MRSFSTHALLPLLLGLFSLGASCDDRSKGGTTASSGSKEAAAAKIEKLNGVDTSSLTSSEQRVWVDLVNELLSPCGEPVSVAQCVAEARSCSACVPAARYVVRLVAEGLERSEIQDHFASRFDDKRKVSIDIGDAPVRGAPMAKITIVEFSDFECPYCGAAHPVLSQTIEQLGGQVNLVFKQFPLEGHKNAMPAARAAIAAQRQGKFWELADLLFEHQRELSPDKIRALAQEAGLDMARFDADVASAEVQERVERDRKDGLALDVQGTPTLFINGRPFREPIGNLTKYLKEELER
jgi:protein-disulfide isomerase